jgi:Tol biopolymer transport system component
VSVASDGTQGNGLSLSSSLSADGRFVAFFSLASTLVEGDTNGVADVFLHDRQAGQTTRVSVASGGAQGDAASSFGFGVISRDGRFITFPSLAGNLVDGDTNGAWDVFVHDAQTGQTARVSLAPDGSQSSGDLIGAPFPSISGDGRLVAFRSAAADLVEGDTNGIRDCFIHDRGTGRTSRATVAADGTQSDGDCEAVLIGGRFALLNSPATNLVPGDTNGVRDVFLAERALSPEALQELIDTVAGMGLPQGIANSLTAKLETALRMLTDDDPSNDTAACGTLAAFVGEVEAQESAGRLSPGQATTLVEAARVIAATSSCS